MLFGVEWSGPMCTNLVSEGRTVPVFQVGVVCSDVRLCRWRALVVCRCSIGSRPRGDTGTGSCELFMRAQLAGGFAHAAYDGRVRYVLAVCRQTTGCPVPTA